MTIWTKLFMEAQGYKICKNILYQDNKSAILLEINGKQSSGKRPKHQTFAISSLPTKSKKETLTLNTAQPMRWLEISIPSLCKAKSVENSETQFLDILGHEKKKTGMKMHIQKCIPKYKSKL